MAEIARILTEVQLEAQKAIQGWQNFGKVGTESLRAVGKAANEANTQMSKMGQFQQKMKGIGTSIADAGQKLQSFGQKMSIGLTVPLGLFGRSAVSAFREQEVALAQLDAAIASTGGTVGVSREEMVKFAEDTQKNFAFADEAVENMQTTLLKFQGITGDTFRKAQSVILDFATRTGQDLSSAAQTIGRSLDDPARGMMLLRRAGVTLTQEQEDLIKSLDATGQSAKAQAKLLELLETKVGGAAAAFAKTDAGQFAIAMNSIGDSMERVGEIIAPVLTDIAKFVSVVIDAFTNLPQPIQEALVYVGMFAAAIGPIAFVLGSVSEGLVLLAAFMAGPWGIAIAIVIASIIALSASFGGFEHWLAAITWGLAEVVQALGELYDKFRWVANGFSSEGLVPSNWGVPIAKAAFEMEKLAREADAAQAKLDGVEGKHEDIETAAKAAAKEDQALADALNGVGDQSKEVAKVEDATKKAANASSSWITKLESIWNWLSKIGQKKPPAAPAAGAGAPGKAGGGLIRGRGSSTSDSIPAWLSDNEFVQRAAAVRKYGVGFMRAVNSLRYPVAMTRGYAGGGLVTSPRMGSAGAGNLGGSGGGRSFNLIIDGKTFADLRAPSDTAAEMMAFAQARKVRSAGRKPNWYS